ncbi:unnamed protein product [marine sediment metagenome]|uniref:Uncharacterized protein n=1 Tax=marine sediment metagenome TaxID=412755 RepID=X0VPJ4_9ZZZZ
MNSKKRTPHAQRQPHPLDGLEWAIGVGKGDDRKMRVMVVNLQTGEEYDAGELARLTAASRFSLFLPVFDRYLTRGGKPLDKGDLGILSNAVGK